MNHLSTRRIKKYGQKPLKPKKEPYINESQLWNDMYEWKVGKNGAVPYKDGKRVYWLESIHTDNCLKCKKPTNTVALDSSPRCIECIEAEMELNDITPR